MRYIGIDYGAKRIGIALSDPSAQFAFPHETIPNDRTALDRIRQIIKREEVGAIVAGDARASNGEANLVTKDAETFIESLKAHLRLPVHVVSEAWSSVEARRFAPQDAGHNDASAAAIILQRFLDTQGQG